jgi:hypothetical protein
MKTKPAALLQSKDAKRVYRIRLVLQEKQTAEFTYSDRFLARTHWDQLQGTGLIGGYAIKNYEYDEFIVDDTEA